MMKRPQAIARRQRSQQNACMASITIRDVPDETRDELAARAARSGRSMQEYLRNQLVLLAETPEPEEVLARIRRRKSSTGSGLTSDDILGFKGADQR
jgi:plasmid stability protein